MVNSFIALEVRAFRMWFAASFGMAFALQMIEVIIGWSVYSHHQSALDLGWIGLAEFIPLFVLALPAGHIADRFPRRYVLACATTLGVVVALALAAVTAAKVRATLPYFALALGAGMTMAIGTPAARAMGPMLVPREMIPNAMTLRSFAGQGAAVIGPAIGGLVYGVSPTAVYLIAAGGLAFATVTALAIGPGSVPDAATATRRQAASLRSVFEGLIFLRHTQIVLGAILLDLFAVLFGGAVALLPIFASHYLHVGAVGLGVLRAGPAVGALLGTIPAVVAGGCATIAIAVIWLQAFPALGRVDRMNELEPVVPATLALTLADGAN